MIRGKPTVLDRWRQSLERHQRQDRAALGREHGVQALDVDIRAHRDRLGHRLLVRVLREEEHAAITKELARQGLRRPYPFGGRLLRPDTAEAGELSPRDPVEGRGHRQVAPVEGKTANTPRLGPVSTSRQRIAARVGGW